MVSFDVKPLFTNVPLNRTIDIILKRIYEKNEIVTSVSKNEMKEMLILCTKKDHFTFESRTYVQTDGVAMSSPLGPVLADIFMIELENSLLPNLTKYITFWKRYVDYTIFFVKTGTTEFIISVLNSFDKNIQFMFEEENDETISFLDILINRKRNNITTRVYRKSTCNDTYLNWNAFAPASWKRGTLVERVYVIFSTGQLLQRELKYLEKVFHEKNNCPKYIRKQVLNKAFEEHNRKNATSTTLDEQNETEYTTEKKHMLVLPYQGKKEDFIIKSMKTKFRNLLPQCIVPKVVFTGSKLSSKFQVKDRTIFSHNHDIIYHGNYPENGCPDNYAGETARRISERVLDHTGKDINSHLYKHSIETGHQTFEISDYRIIGNEYENNWNK